MNIAVLASGKGTNFAAIAKAVKRRYIKAGLKVLITDKKNAPVRARAKKLKIEEIFVNPHKFRSRLEFEKEIIAILNKRKIDLIVLAGFMRIFSPYFVKKFKNMILNIHPALLPSFKGLEAVEKAFKYGSKISGVTVHFVDEKTDHGPIILQEAVKIKDKITLDNLREEIHKVEHKLYPKAIKLVSERRVKVRGRHVEII